MEQQQPTHKSIQTPTPEDEQSNANYTTHINELISQPATENIYLSAAQYIFSSLFELSSYLFKKKLGQFQEEPSPQSQADASFNTYLTEMGEQLGRFGRQKASKQLSFARESINIQSQLVKCYQRVESIYFEEKYFLDLSYFQLFYSELKSSNQNQRKKVNKQLDSLVEELDMVQINLFSQIHCKFQEYFAVAANFQYLQESVNNQLRKLKESRTRIQRVKSEIVDKSAKLREKIVQRQNIQKALKTIKIMKSIKKLPQVMESILASSLPYDCLELLQQTKSSLETVKHLKCMANTSQSIKAMQALAQNDLTKRYSNDLYLYLEECFQRDSVHLQQIWRKLQVRTCLDKDNSLIIDQLNSSNSSMQSENQIILDNIEVENLNKGSKMLIPRLEERQYQIAMILLQSYQYITFTPEVIKIKVCNALRKFSKSFEKELLSYLNRVVRQQLESKKDNEKILGEDFEVSPKKDKEVPAVLPKRESEEEVSPDVVEKVTVEYYTKHLGVLNDIFRETIMRFLGYLETLISEYEEELIVQSEGQNSSKVGQRHRKFKSIFVEECSMLPSIFKIIEEKIKYLLTLKNIRNISSLQYYQWISILKYWQRFFDYLIQEHSLLNLKPKPDTAVSNLVHELTQIVLENVRRAINAMNLKSLLLDLTVDYINVFHNNTLENEIINTLQEDTWQSTEVPQEFSDILNNILNPEGTVLNASITILDSSSTKSNASRDSSRDLSKGDIRDESKVRIKFKLLKNNILVGGVRYKVNLSLIILCETIAEYVKMNRILSGILPREFVVEAGYNKITKHIYDKIFDLLYKFGMKSKELILETKALNFGKIKAKTINAKHICLLANCYSVLIKISEELLERGKLQSLTLLNTQQNTIGFLQNAHDSLIKKLSTILNSRVDRDINDYITQQKSGPNPNPSLSLKTNNSIITAFLQMVEITDEYLQLEDVKKVLRAGFQTLSQKYFTHLLLKGDKFRSEVELLAEKLKFLKKYFILEYEALLKEIPS